MNVTRLDGDLEYVLHAYGVHSDLYINSIRLYVAECYYSTRKGTTSTFAIRAVYIGLPAKFNPFPVTEQLASSI